MKEIGNRLEFDNSDEMLVEQESVIDMPNPRRFYSGKDKNGNDLFTCAAPFNPYDGKLVDKGRITRDVNGSSETYSAERYIPSSNQKICPYLSWMVDVDSKRIEYFLCDLGNRPDSRYNDRYFTNKQPEEICVSGKSREYEIFNLNFK